MSEYEDDLEQDSDRWRADDLSWPEVARLLDTQASEAQIGRRVRELREARGWKQSTLVAQLDKLQIPLSQPAISRIENMGSSDAKDDRRAIGVREIIGLARVFDVSVVELMIPGDAFDELTGWREFVAAAEDLNRVRTAWFDYSTKIGALRNRVRSTPRLRQRIESAHIAALDKHTEGKRAWFDRHPEFLPATFEEFLSWQDPTPELAALEDVLSSHPSNPTGWWRGRVVEKIDDPLIR